MIGKCTNCGVGGHTSQSCKGQKRKVKHCPGCGLEKSLKAFYKNISAASGLKARCKDCCRAEYNPKIERLGRMTEYLARKTEVINHYGGKCVCCGQNNIGFLSLDHSNDDGAEHRKSLKEAGERVVGSDFYKWLKKNSFPSDLGLRVMCYNCNVGRARNNGFCPHILHPIDRIQKFKQDNNL